MAAVGWIGFMLFLLLTISMGEDTEWFTVRCDVGQTVTLPCKHTMSDCSMVIWLLDSNSNPSPAIELVGKGNVTGKETQKAGRLTVGSNCSLHINNLNIEDTGRYTCRLYHNDNYYTDISAVSLSVGESLTMSSVELSVRLVFFFIILIIPPIIAIIYTKSRNHPIRDQVSSGTELQEYVNG